jgi:hypothetical protein
VGVSELEAKQGVYVDARIHAGEDCELAGRGTRQIGPLDLTYKRSY